MSLHALCPRARGTMFRVSLAQVVCVLTSPVLLLLASASAMAEPPAAPIVIAHRGASGYLPEHTLAAKALAYGQGADYLEQDVVLTRDGVPIVLHDIHLETISDVETKFPGRSRKDGRYYAIDFTLAEIRELRIGERINPRTGKAVFPSRFPAEPRTFHIPTLAEELEFVRGLNNASQKSIGIYPELKRPDFHRDEGYDLTRAVLDVLAAAGYTESTDAVFLQCFDAEEVRRIRHELKCPLPLVQLLDKWPANIAATSTEEAEANLRKVLEQIGGDADGIGISLRLLFNESPALKLSPERVVELAREAGLFVHVWTLRADQFTGYAPSFEELHGRCLAAQIDGAFTDFPDITIRHFRDPVDR